MRIYHPEREAFWTEMSTSTGLAATSGLICTLILPSRLKSVSKAFGVNGIHGAHRFLGVFTLGMTLLHLISVIIADPLNVLLLYLPAAPGRAQSATLGTVSLILLVGGAMARHKFKRYEIWRWSHTLLTVIALILVALHIWLLGQLIFDPLWQLMFGILTAVALLVLGYRWGWKAITAQSSRFIVTEMRAESSSVTTVALTRREMPIFEPGQFAWVRLQRSFAAEDHPFTIASAPGDDRIEFTIRHAGDWTRDQLAHLRPGRAVWIDGPHGGMTLDPYAAGLVMIANGVGVTPMMSMVRSMDRSSDDRPAWLILITRTGGILFRDELTELSERINLTVVELVNQPIEVSTIEPVLPQKYLRGQCTYYICGSPSLVADSSVVLGRLGVPASRVLTEQFDVA